MATALAVLLDIPVLREFLGLVFLTFIPGLLILHILRLDGLPLPEKGVLSIGLSLTFIMLFGLAENYGLLAAGYQKPLSLIPVVVSFSLATIALGVVAYRSRRKATLLFSEFVLSRDEKALLVPPSLFPLLSIGGMQVMNSTSNNIYLMLLLFLIVAYVIFISLYHSRVPERVYPGLIFLIGISLTLMWSLRSNYILGGDTHREYFYFQAVLNEGRWQPLRLGDMDSILSISILPAIYQFFLDINPEFLFKVLYSGLISSLPVTVYIFTKKYVGPFYAFLASLFLVSEIAFLATPAQVRANLSVAFFALIIMALFHESIRGVAKKTLIILFLTSVLFSHYATTYISFFVLLMTWAGMQTWVTLMPGIRGLAMFGKKGAAFTGVGSPLSRYQLRVGISITVVAFILALIFLWYSQVIGNPFENAVRQIAQGFTSTEEFFEVESRGDTVSQALGTTVQKHISKRIEFVVSWLTILFIGVGILATLIKFKKMVSLPGAHPQGPFLLSRKFDAEYFVLAIMCGVVLVASLLIPTLLREFDMSRLYFQMVVPLAVFFVVGGMAMANYIKLPAGWVILLILIPFFMSTTGALAQVTGFPRSVALNSKGVLYDIMYVHDQEAYAARWLGQRGELSLESQSGFTRVFSDPHGVATLISAGRISPRMLDGSIFARLPLRNASGEGGEEFNGYAYLSYFYTVKSRSLGDGEPLAPFGEKLAGMNRIYANGATEVYR